MQDQGSNYGEPDRRSDQKRLRWLPVDNEKRDDEGPVDNEQDPRNGAGSASTTGHAPIS